VTMAETEIGTITVTQTPAAPKIIIEISYFKVRPRGRPVLAQTHYKVVHIGELHAVHTL
jgi:hypothetical protein